MNSSTLIFVILFLALFSYWFGIQRSIKVAGGVTRIKKLTSLPRQFGMLTALWCGLPALLVLLVWSAFESSVIEYLLISQLPAAIQSAARLGTWAVFK